MPKRSFSASGEHLWIFPNVPAFGSNIVAVTSNLRVNPVARADAVICTSEVENIPAKVKEITGGDLAYGAVDAVAGTMTGVLLVHAQDKAHHITLPLLVVIASPQSLEIVSAIAQAEYQVIGVHLALQLLVQR